MRIFVAGSTGVLGIRVVPLLVAGGHDVTGMTRPGSKIDALRDLGAVPVVCDVYDADVLQKAVVGSGAELILHLLTSLPDKIEEMDAFTAANARIRREGTRNLLAAAATAGASRFVAESVAWRLSGDAGAAVDDLERSVLAVGGIILRYGQLYGPGTYHEDEPPEPPRIHVDEAARRTAASIDEPTGIVELVEAV
jgi:uncharacterized protein YbjT (DUF2867 family)